MIKSLFTLNKTVSVPEGSTVLEAQVDSFNAACGKSRNRVLTKSRSMVLSSYGKDASFVRWE